MKKKENICGEETAQDRLYDGDANYRHASVRPCTDEKRGRDGMGWGRVMQHTLSAIPYLSVMTTPDPLIALISINLSGRHLSSGKLHKVPSRQRFSLRRGRGRERPVMLLLLLLLLFLLVVFFFLDVFVPDVRFFRSQTGKNYE